MPTFSTQHHTIYYVTAGNSASPSLLLLHGFLGSHADFSPLLPTLSQHFHCIVPDLPGHGKTCAKENTYNFQTASESLKALLQHLNISRTRLAGYSMGGRLALYLTCLYPALISRVVLESASPGLQSLKEQQTRQQKDDAIAHTLETTPFPTFLTHWYNNPLFADLKRHQLLFQQMLQRRADNNPQQLARALRGFSTGRQPSLWQNLEAIEQPVLLLTGKLDQKFIDINKKMLEACHQNSPSLAKIIVVKDCGHNVHLASPTAYLDIMTQFLL
ncbi:MAG: 2-succinyl-6-hydroxy-2,4-cyclohexadiene-1-carboxylate synthase [Cyanobacteria bacterium J06643_4]